MHRLVVSRIKRSNPKVLSHNPYGPGELNPDYFSRIRHRVGLIMLALGMLFPACNASAQAPFKPDEIHRLARPIILDGKMGDPAWKTATRFDDFKTVHPEAGKSPSARTDVYLAYNDTTLHVAIRSFDPEPAKIRATAVTQADAWKDDWAVLCLNPYDDSY